MIETTAIRDAAGLGELRDEWAELHSKSHAGTPFEHPGWAQVWAEYFVPDGDLECVAVRDSDLGGALIGFAPMYRGRHSFAGVRARCIRPLGTGGREELTEVVQVLALPDRTSEVLRALVYHLESLQGWSWAQLSLGPDQGWLLPQWLDDPANGMIKQRNTRPCVIISDLPSDVDSLRSGLKRNVRESVRRSKNRSAKHGGMTFRCASEVDDVATSVRRLIELHRMRARMGGKVEHSDKFSSELEGDFLVRAASALARDGLARVHLAEHFGEPVAALLVLSDAGTDYLSVTGLNPDFWELSLNTMLIFQALSEAIGRGRRSFNLSTGPDIAKLRWTSTVTTFHDFAIVRSDRKSRLLYAAFAHASLALDNRSDARQHRVLSSGS